MKKTLLAAALITGFAGVAHAESSVTLYGLIDAGYGYQNTETKYRGDFPGGKVARRHIGVQDSVLNGNRWGLKGTEDLGNGTSAIFVLEGGFNVGTGESEQGGKLFGRQAYVGLSGENWGTFTIGRQYNAGDDFVSPIDPFVTAGGYASAISIFGNSLSQRYDNTIKYVTPDFSGFQFGIGAVHGDDRIKTSGFFGSNKVTTRTAGVTAGLSYTNGPIYVGASFDYINNKEKRTILSITSTSDTKTKAWNIGGTYDFDVAKLHLMYGGQRDGAIGGNLGLAGSGMAWNPITQDVIDNGLLSGFDSKGLRQHSWLVGLTAPVGDAGTVMFSYAGNTMKNNKGSVWSSLPNGTAKAKSHNFGLGYRHNLSKRTSVYGVASYGWSNAKVHTSFGGFSFNGKAKTTASQAIIGLQHRF